MIKVGLGDDAGQRTAARMNRGTSPQVYSDEVAVGDSKSEAIKVTFEHAFAHGADAALFGRAAARFPSAMGGGRGTRGEYDSALI